MPRPALVRVSLVAAGAGLGATTAVTITAETLSQRRAVRELDTGSRNRTGGDARLSITLGPM